MIKQFIKKLAIGLGIDLTKNIHYDRLTLKILDKVLKQDSNCIDIGCHKGEILDEILKRAPHGKHMAFEPIPDFYKELVQKFENKDVKVFDFALSDKSGETTFNYVVDDPAYSGIKERDYKIKEPTIEKLNVKLETLDNILPEDYRLDFIKLDVEGAEFNVLKGAEKTLKKYSPVVIFEFGLGASDHYNVDPSQFFRFFSSTCNYRIFQLEAFLKNKNALTEEKFLEFYKSNSEYYFIASATH